MNISSENSSPIELREGDDESEIVVIVSGKEIGKVIGKQGKIARAIRTLVKAASGKSSVRYNVVIQEREENAAE